MGYDMRPLVTLDEKAQVLKMAGDNGYVLYFEHDPVHEAATVALGEKGYALKEYVTLNNL
jgi:hypothetical protein